jgi:hypothetical protein
MRNNPRKQGVLLSLSRFSGPVRALEMCVLIMKTPRMPFIGSYKIFAFKVLKLLTPNS